MTLSPTLLSDLEEIRQLRPLFGRALDARDWDVLPAILAEEIEVDLTALGVPASVMPREAFEAVFRHSFRHDQVRTVQTYTNLLAEVSGDEATCVSILYGWHRGDGFEGGDLFEIRARYHDRLRRGPDGWRITGTRLEVIDLSGNMALVS